MKKWLLMLLVCLLPVCALAEAALPPTLHALLAEEGLTVTSALSFDGTDGRQWWLVTDGHWLNGYAGRNDEWQMTLSTLPLFDMRPLRLVRVAEEENAFALTSPDGGSYLMYRFDGEGFVLVGWCFPGYPEVTRQDDLLVYDTDGMTAKIVMSGEIDDFPWNKEDLPLTPAQAMERMAISEEAARDMFPGYTLRQYSAYNSGTAADAAYSCVRDGLLFIRRVGLTAGYEPRVVDCTPVPLSARLIARLATEPFDTLISCMQGDRTFCTQDAFDRISLTLPEEAVIHDNQVQEKSVIALTELDGVRYLNIWEIDEDAGPNGDGYYVRRTQPLPPDASLDLFHAGDGMVQLEWAQQDREAAFGRHADGQWRLEWAANYGVMSDLRFSASAFGIWEYDEEGGEHLRIGTLAGSDLFSAHLDEMLDAPPVLDRTGWAVVNNPNPADRLHLRTEPSRSSRSQGKFYNGTPVRVLGTEGNWTQVQIGFGHTALTGWMMTEFLTFGTDMDRVVLAFPDLCYREEYLYEQPGGFWVAGVEEDLYILLCHDGRVEHVPQTWLFEGYG